MNVKSLAFETNPVNEGKAVDKFETQKYKGANDWFLKEIEERLRERAGNLPLKDKYTYHEKVTPAQKIIKQIKPETFGSGITEEEIQKIIKAFS